MNNKKEENLEKRNFSQKNIKSINIYDKISIEKSYNIENIKSTEAYYSNRYGWTLRKTLK
tara:strand:- start:521 stop:700 length:180 start_codon:yes stop_codon:yes gene_type:complete